MRLNNRFVVIAAVCSALVASAALAQDKPRPDEARDGPPPSAGPSGTSDRTPDRYDEVGYAYPDAAGPGGFVVLARGLPVGSYVEVTSLDSGRTTLAVTDAGEPTAGTVAALSPAVASAIGLDRRAGVRVRRVIATPADQNALSNGKPPSARLDAPAALLAGLRTRMPAGSARTVRPARALARIVPTPSPEKAPTPPPPASASARPRQSPAAARGPALYVQLAAFSTAERANTLARSVGGSVTLSGKLYRVRTGPFATPAAAERARDDAARRGYGGARIVRDD